MPKGILGVPPKAAKGEKGCLECHTRLYKNGKNPRKKQRYMCPLCGASYLESTLLSKQRLYTKKCHVIGCTRKHRGKGFCEYHRRKLKEKFKEGYLTLKPQSEMITVEEFESITLELKT